MARTVADLFPFLDPKALHRILAHIEHPTRTRSATGEPAGAGWEVVRATPSTNLVEFCDHVGWLLDSRAMAA